MNKREKMKGKKIRKDERTRKKRRDQHLAKLMSITISLNPRLAQEHSIFSFP
jgi:hypothetical protein